MRAKVVATLAATNKPDHISFLKHFGKFVVAGIDQKPVGKEEYLLAKLDELSREMGRLRIEQQEFSSAFIGSSHRNFLTASSLPSPEDFIMDYLKRSKFTPSDVICLKDPQSEIFRRLHREYIDKVVARAVNPKGRHESIAEMDLMKAIQRIFP